MAMGTRRARPANTGPGVRAGSGRRSGGMRTLAVFVAIVAGLGAGTEWAVSRARDSGWGALRDTMRAEIARGALPALLRARMVGVRLAAAAPEDADTSAELAFTSAYLARTYGLRFEAEAHAAAERASAPGDKSPRAAVATAARALIELGRGNVKAARSYAARAAGLDPASVEPLLALADVRATTGDLRAAAKTLEAAVVLAPERVEVRVAWAEARLDLGDAVVALDVLREVLARAPEHTRARLLLAEATRAASAAWTDSDPTLGAHCRRDGAISPTVTAACAVAEATAARLAGRHDAARVELEEVVRIAPEVRWARLLAIAAQISAQLGLVDQAGALAERGAALGSEAAPSVAWARLAIALGRGEAPVPVPGVPPSGPEATLVGARAAFAAGGRRALGQYLEEHPAFVRSHPDLRLLSRMAEGAVAVAAGPSDRPGPEDGPVAAYVEGLRARLSGDLPAAADLLGRALEGHGDACRALGEYVATLRALKQNPEAPIFERVRRVNARCVNLPEVGPPESAAPRSRRKRQAKSLSRLPG